MTIIRHNGPAFPKVACSVNHPPHYTKGSIECIAALRSALSPEEFAGLCKGSAIQYIWRSAHKGSTKQDIEKAIWYLNRYLSSLPL